MTNPPAYFEDLRARAAQRWEQLERDPDLAGPWHQLFKQVQSPRHIVSELLQNADDAGATEASVRIEDGVFSFEHNGEDFTEEHLLSLCRFGYSNKRALHTIGFRGIGFKSTFSLGDSVELHTPTLSIAFDRHRFTEPRWINGSPAKNSHTEVRVSISDQHRQRELETNLADWLESPISLLFFKHIRRLRIDNREVHWRNLGHGPVPGTASMALHDNADKVFLLARSKPEPFPAEALSEIKQERLLGVDEDTDFPPCIVEIVLGAKGRLFVVLPTGVETTLPFACNAPFIQDPARLKIKDPETSPTNRWLLKRVGQLAASTMLQWLEQSEIDIAERSRAYGLFTNVDRNDSSLEGICAETVQNAFDATIAGQNYLLAEDEQLKPANQSIIIPEAILSVWPADQAATLLDDETRPAFSRHVQDADKENLIQARVIAEVTPEQVLDALRRGHLPSPGTWRQLLNLWSYVAKNTTPYPHHAWEQNLRILPAQGKEILYSANEVARLGEKKLVESADDWAFLANHLLVLNQNWTRYLAEQRRTAEANEDEAHLDKVNDAYAVLTAIGLAEASDFNKVIDRVAAELFEQDVPLSNCIRFTQIAAKLGVSTGKSFIFVTEDGLLRSNNEIVLFDQEGSLRELLPVEQHKALLLHRDYTSQFNSCSKEEWLRWVMSERSGLKTFVPIVQTRTFSGDRVDLDDELVKRTCLVEFETKYKNPWFFIDDWDFGPSFWEHWEASAEEDPLVWGKIADRILSERNSYWSDKESALIIEQASNRNTKTVIREGITPSWILKLRNVPCLRDTRGFLHRPDDLLRRTPATEPLMDVEPFIHVLLDTPSTRPLLSLLGVRDAPTGPERLLDCLRALAKADNPPPHEVEKWYRRLDHLLDTCSTTDVLTIKTAFNDEQIILTDRAAWTDVAGVFLFSDEEDVPDAAVIRPSVRDLTLWRKIGVAERPNVELAIKWLKNLPSGERLSPENIRRIRALLVRHPFRVWNECGHWLNLSSEWVPVSSLKYALTMQSLVPWSHLHEWVKQQTADFQRLSADTTEASPFLHLPALASQIAEYFHGDLVTQGTPESLSWLNQLGLELRLVELDSEAETVRVRTLACDLAETNWQTAPNLEIIPYIDGIPAGTPRRTEAVWLDRTLYAEDQPMAQLARPVAQELGRMFVRHDIADAIKLCFDRSPKFVTEYVEANFKLTPREEIDTGNTDEKLSTDEKSAPDTDAQSPQLTEGRTPPGATVGTFIGDEVFTLSGEPEDEDVAKEDIVKDEEDQIETSDGDDKRPGDNHHREPVKPTVIERFARSQGFNQDQQGRFLHTDGTWIGKTIGDRFPWEKRSASGDVICYYWPKDHCLERQSLELEADVWGLIDIRPETYALILINPEGDPIEVPGVELQKMLENGELTFHPATYRIVYKHDRPT